MGAARRSHRGPCKSRLRLGELHLGGELSEETRLVWSRDVVLRLVAQNLPPSLQSIHLEVDGKVFAQVSELDQIWKVKRVPLKSISCCNHGGRDDLAGALDEADKEVDEVTGLSCLHLQKSEKEV